MTADAVQVVGGSAVLLQRLAVLDAYYLVSSALRAARRGSTPPPDRMLALQRALATAAEQVRETSPTGHDDVACPSTGAQSESTEDIGTEAAATLLGLGRRQVQRLAGDLDGRRVGRSWVFDRRAVESYAHARTTSGEPAA